MIIRLTLTISFIAAVSLLSAEEIKSSSITKPNFEQLEKQIDDYYVVKSPWTGTDAELRDSLYRLMGAEVGIWKLRTNLKELNSDDYSTAAFIAGRLHEEVLSAAQRALPVFSARPNPRMLQLLILHLETYPFSWSQEGWEELLPSLKKLPNASGKITQADVQQETGIVVKGDPVKGVCVDGDRERTFAVSTAIPEKVLKGGYYPEVVCAEDKETTKSITWVESPTARPLVTIIGRYKGHEIIDITFPVIEVAEAKSQQPFEAKVLAYRVEAAAASPMLPFFFSINDDIRWYDQIFTCDGNNSLKLEVSKTLSGNGVHNSNFTFGFGEGHAYIEEMTSGGRNQKGRITKFKPDGSVSYSREERDEN